MLKKWTNPRRAETRPILVSVRSPAFQNEASCVGNGDR